TDVFNGAQLQIQTPLTGPLAGQPIVVSGEALTLSGTGIFGSGAILNTGGSNTWQGPITLESTPGIPAPPPALPPTHVTFAAEPLTINGDGVAPANLGALRNVQGSNTWTGTITLATSSSIGADAGSQLTVTGTNRVISAAAVDLRKVGPGVVVFATDNNT